MAETVGRQRVLSDMMDPARAAALHVALGRDGAPPAAGDPLPPFGHHLYFWDPVPPRGLGRDGHPTLGAFLPDMGLPRRMWAGGRLNFARPVRLGEAAEMTHTVATATRKAGRTGPLAFVTVRHELRQAGQLCVTEEQDIVYRTDPGPDTPAPVPPKAPAQAERAQQMTFDSTLLFRYSALTFNGHRIHYDLDYCREVEGYPGLIVHGPLLAQGLMLMAEEMLGTLRRFDFRATAPLFHFEAAELCATAKGDGLDMWARGPDGRLCLTGTAC